MRKSIPRKITIIFLVFTGFLLGLFPHRGSAAHLHWEVVTNLNDARQILLTGDTLFAATSGGFLQVRRPDNQFQTWTSGEGLSDHNFSAVTRSAAHQQIILGSANGLLTFFDLKTQSFREDASLAGNAVLGLTAIGDTLWAVSKTMVAVYQFQPDRGYFEFRDFFTNFNHDFQSFQDIAYFRGDVWVSSDNGLFHAPGNYLKYNLKSADTWQVLTSADGLPANQFYSFARRADTLLIGSEKGLVFYDGTQFTGIFKNLPNPNLYRVHVQDGRIYVSSRYRIARFTGSEFTVEHDIYPNRINDFTVTPAGEILAAVSEKGLWNLTDHSRLYLNGPTDNNLGKVLKDSQGRLWVTSGIYKDQRFRGFSVRLTDGTWRNFRYIGPGWKLAASAGAISEDAGGNIWIGSWGGGLTIIDPEFHFYHFNRFSTPGQLWISSPTEDDTITFSPPDSVSQILSSVIGFQEVVVVTDILPDKERGAIWLLNLTPQNHKPIVKYQYDTFSPLAFQASSWQGYSFPGSVNVENDVVAAMTTDIFGNLWIGTGSSGVVGMIFSDTGDTSWVWFTESKNLKNNQCWAVAGDEDGYVWFGTNSGVNAYLNGQLFDFREDYQPIGLRINGIFVDSENNKWFATDKGLSLLRAKGSPWDPHNWLHIVPQNSELFGDNIFHTNLPSEEVRSVTVDPENGDVYCGTASGLAILRSNPFTTPLKALDQVTAGPNPFIISDQSGGFFYFRNLTANSEVKILAPSGRLVRVLNGTHANEILGSLAQWDGRNQQGRLVASGVYLYLVTDENGHSTAGKFLVIRE